MYADAVLPIASDSRWTAQRWRRRRKKNTRKLQNRFGWHCLNAQNVLRTSNVSRIVSPSNRQSTHYRSLYLIPTVESIFPSLAQSSTISSETWNRLNADAESAAAASLCVWALCYAHWQQCANTTTHRGRQMTIRDNIVYFYLLFAKLRCIGWTIDRPNAGWQRLAGCCGQRYGNWLKYAEALSSRPYIAQPLHKQSLKCIQFEIVNDFRLIRNQNSATICN